MDIKSFLLQIAISCKNLLIGPGWIIIFSILSWIAKHWHWHRRWRQRLLIAAIAYALLCTMPPIPELLTWGLIRMAPQVQPTKSEAIVVFGGGINPQGAPSDASAQRAEKAAVLWQGGYAPIIVASGGPTFSQRRTEAEAMAIVLRGLGVPDEAIVLENQSYNTYQNAVESSKILRDRHIGKVILVTSRTHLLRASLTFEQQGIATIPIAAEFKPPRLNWNPVPSWRRGMRLQSALNEYIGILGYWFQGKLEF